MSKLRIVPRNFHDEATLSVQLDPASSEYAVGNTQNTQRTSVWRSATGADQYIAGYFADGLARTVSHFSMFRHRCHGGQVRAILYSDAGWTTQVYDSGLVNAINVVPTDGLNWGVNPYGSGSIDPFLTDAPFWLWFTPVACLSYKVFFSTNVSTYGYSYWQACRFFLGKYYELPYNVLYDNALGFVDLTDRNRTRGASLQTNIGPGWREFSADIKRLPEADRAGWIDIKKRVGTGRDFVLSLFPELATRKERDHIINGKFKTLDPIVRWHPLFLSTRIQIEEV
jgi:hypothetical protein